jgi:glycosyltransferase involved in cell wall biosynthesis
VVTVAFDATPLLGERTGIGTAVGGWLAALARRPDLRMRAYGLTLTGWRSLPGELPAGVRWVKAPLAAGVAQRVWARTDFAPTEWWAGPVRVVHGTNFVVPPARRAARVLTVWDLTCVRYPQLCPPAALRFPDLVARAVERGATVHVPSHAVADEVAEHFAVPAERLVVVAPGVEPARRLSARPATLSAGRPAPPAAPAGGPEPGVPYVLALGTVEPRKDLPTLVRAFDAVADRHPDLVLKIAGPEGWGEDELRLAIDAAAHRRRIERLGWLADPAEVMAGAALFAFPSLYEGFGFPPLEAMAAGVPVVATAAGSVPEVVGDAALLVPVGDADALAAALDRALQDSAERERLVAAGVARVAEFSWQRAGDGLADLYLRLAGD